MTTLEQYTAIKLAVVHKLSFEEAQKIVAEEVKSWQIAGILLPWQQSIQTVSLKVKRQAWFSVETRLRELKL